MTLSQFLYIKRNTFFTPVPFQPETDGLVHLDATEKNGRLQHYLDDKELGLEAYVQQLMKTANARYAYGGYGEKRVLYRHFHHFNPTHAAPRNIHLGVDIWAEPGTPVIAPIGGMVHSYAYNNARGDYGATIILSHQLDGRQFYTLYGHLSLADLETAKEGNYLVGGQAFAQIGSTHENGGWPPHLHFQLIEDIGLNEGDYPGVCSEADKANYLANCPNPDIILQWMSLLPPVEANQS